MRRREPVRSVHFLASICPSTIYICFFISGATISEQPPSPSFHSLSTLFFECIILTCHSRVYDVLIYCHVAPAHPCRRWNKSQWSSGDETAGCVFLCVAYNAAENSCLLSRHANNASTTENGGRVHSSDNASQAQGLDSVPCSWFH